MKIFRSEEYLKIKNPTPGEAYRTEILSPEHQAKDLGGIFGVLVAGGPPRYHYHNKRESNIIVISGEASEIVDGKEYLIKAGDVLFIPPKVKHGIINRSDKDFRFLEFFTCPPVGADFVQVEYKQT